MAQDKHFFCARTLFKEQKALPFEEILVSNGVDCLQERLIPNGMTGENE